MPFRIVAMLRLAALCIIACSASAVAADDPAALIKRQSQAFSDASATGNVAVFRRYLDDAVVFINENGDQLTKADLIAGAAPSPSGASQTLRQTDWRIALHGSVAVTAFTDVSFAHFHGQRVMAKFRSTEVWLKENDGWRMISSQTLALQDDPPAVTLPGNVLDEYVGSYTAGPGYVVVISHTGANLSASVNGAPPVVMKAELKDVFFIAGQPRLRRIFMRNVSGALIGFVSRREGHDIRLKRVT